MDRIKLLQERKSAIRGAGETAYAQISELFDEDSFVELGAFSFSKSAFYEEPNGEGVLTGFATIDGYPFYVVAQNFASSFGGLTKAHCEKIARLLSAAEKNETPVLYLLHSQGAQIGEGVEVLEGISELLLSVSRLKGIVPQYAIVGEKVYGAAAAIASCADLVFFLKDSALAITSPLVLSAKEGKNLKKEEVGGFEALKRANLPAVEAKDLQEVSALLRKTTELLGIPVQDGILNESAPVLNDRADADSLWKILEDPIEIGKNCAPEVKTVLCRVGGISIAAVLFDRVYLNALNLKKIKAFADFASAYSLPFVTFVDCLGLEESLSANDSELLKEMIEYFETLDTIGAKVAIVTGKAIGLGYSLFAAKSSGFDYTFASANAGISLFDDKKGASIVYQDASPEAIERYFGENADPVHAAKGGYLDNIVEPQFIKQYLIASLQTLLR